MATRHHELWGMPTAIAEREPLLRHNNISEDDASRLYLVCLTCGIGGLQIIFSVILSNGSPYLISLGLSKSHTALVWFAAPFLGSLIQPLVGSWSDRLRSPWGRRRPLILVGAIGVSASMMLLAWASNIVQHTNGANHNREGQGLDPRVIAFAVIWILALYISIQLIQAGVRSLIVESLPFEQQARGSKYAGMMQALGNVLGYLFGFLILPVICPADVSPFQLLSVFSLLVLDLTVLTTCIVIKEKVYDSDDEAEHHENVFVRLYRTYFDMPRTIREVCKIQFLSWMAWFPLLFYATTYVGEFYAGRRLYHNKMRQRKRGTPGAPERSRISDEAIRYGTFATLLFAIVTLISSLLLPRLLEKVTKSRLLGTGQGSIKPTLIQIWKFSHFYFALLMLLTFLIESEALATAVVALAGLSWAVTLLIPFAIINMELTDHRGVESDDTSITSDVVALRQTKQIGAIMGLHNMSISLPQPIGALMSSAIYAIVNALDLADGTGWVLRGGGVLALMAAFLCWRLY